MSEYYKEAKEILIPVLDKIGMKKSEKDEKIEKNWPEIAGPRISPFASFKGIDKKTLLIETNDAHYLPLILAQQKRIIDRYNSIFPSEKIKYLKVIVSSM